MENHDILIKKTLYTKNGTLKSKFINGAYTKYKNITEYLEKRYNDSESRAETLARIRFNIEEKPKCKECGKPLKYRSYNHGHPDFGIWCSLKCKSNSQEVKNKIITTSLKRYGVINGGGSKEAINKIRETNYKKTGYYSDLSNPVVKEKIKQTNYKKYGIYYACNLPHVELAAHTEKANEKRIKTKNKNNTWTTSKIEENLFNYIKIKFPLVKRQYKDKKRYPWFCDFYIPEYDCFIELNGTWTHGKHPFNINSEEDINLLNEWKIKYDNGKHPYYMGAIKTWTIYDVKKRETAKKNNLNFYEFWNIEDAKKFIDKLYS